MVNSNYRLLESSFYDRAEIFCDRAEDVVNHVLLVPIYAILIVLAFIVASVVLKYRECVATPQEKKGTILFVYPAQLGGDCNRETFFKLKVESKYDVIRSPLYPSGEKNALQSRLEEHVGNPNIKAIWISGHGNSKGISHVNEEESEFDATELKTIHVLQESLRKYPNGLKIILDACSTGKEENGTCFAKELAKIAPLGSTVYAAKEDIHWADLQINDEDPLENLTFKTIYYGDDLLGLLERALMWHLRYIFPSIGNGFPKEITAVYHSPAAVQEI